MYKPAYPFYRKVCTNYGCRVFALAMRLIRSILRDAGGLASIPFDGLADVPVSAALPCFRISVPPGQPGRACLPGVPRAES